MLAGLLAAIGITGLPVAVLGYVAGANLLLALFNLIPATPLDGGRILQAVVWWRTGDRRRGTRVAATAEQQTSALEERLAGMRVADVMTAEPVTGIPSFGPTYFTEQAALPHPHYTYPLVDLEGHLARNGHAGAHSPGADYHESYNGRPVRCKVC